METYTIGTANQFYGLPLPPEVRFTSGVASFPLPANMFDVTIACNGFPATIPPKTLFSDSNAVLWLYRDTAENNIHWRIKVAGVDNFGNIINTSSAFTLRVFRDVDNIVKYSLNNGGTVSTNRVADSVGSVLWLGRRGDGYFPNPALFGATYLKINDNSYIKQGDQSNTTVVPSTPAGANGTLSGGASWQYPNIMQNYLTPALFLSAVTTPTEPVVVEILDPSIDVSGIPATINGQPVTIQCSYVPRDVSFGFGFGFTF